MQCDATHRKHTHDDTITEPLLLLTRTSLHLVGVALWFEWHTLVYILFVCFTLGTPWENGKSNVIIHTNTHTNAAHIHGEFLHTHDYSCVVSHTTRTALLNTFVPLGKGVPRRRTMKLHQPSMESQDRNNFIHNTANKVLHQKYNLLNVTKFPKFLFT